MITETTPEILEKTRKEFCIKLTNLVFKGDNSDLVEFMKEFPVELIAHIVIGADILNAVDKKAAIGYILGVWFMFTILKECETASLEKLGRL